MEISDSSATAVSALPFWVALGLGLGSLLCYLTLAALSRMASGSKPRGSQDFITGVPDGQDLPQLFGISLAAAGTPLSTAVMYFFLSGSSLGARLFLCPVFFLLGTYLSFFVYSRARVNGYFDAKHSHGREALIPHLCKKLTGNVSLGRFVLVLCILPLLSLLTLEIAWGIQIIQYITEGAFHSKTGSPWVFAIFMVLLLGYVFVGGFRAVLRSDVWQFRLVCTAVVATLASLFLYWLYHRSVLPLPDWKALWPSSTDPKDPDPFRLAFYVPVIAVDLVVPVGLASSWQRFRAFDLKHIDMRPALMLGLKKTALLWSGLIAVALGFVVFGVSKGDTLPALFDGILSKGDWWQFFLFPLLAAAALSAMYSCSDTCVSALLYLMEYSETEDEGQEAEERLSRSYYWFMALIFTLTLTLYWLLTRNSNPGTFSGSPLFTIAVTGYASVCVIAPTLFLTTVLRPAVSESQKKQRTRYITASLLAGFVTFWGCTIYIKDSPWLVCAIVPALLLSALAVWLLYLREPRTFTEVKES